MSKEYMFHEFADIFPLMTKDELEALAIDIKKNGLLEEIILYEEKILDGRNRYLACQIADITPKLRIFSNKIDPLDYVIAENLVRRHLSAAQKGEIGIRILPLYQERAKKRQNQSNKLERNNLGHFINKPLTPSEGVSGKKGEALEIIAKKLGTSKNTIQIARKVEKLKDPQITKKWNQAKKGNTTIKAVRTAIIEIEKAKKPKPKTPEGMFELIYADPPWQYNFTSSPSRTIEKEYPTMTLKEICSLKIPSAKDCVLFLWCPAPKLYPEGITVIKEWGFTYKTCMVWIKDKIGMGYYGRNRHELLLIATKGNPGTPIPKNRPDSVIEAPRTNHSEKPGQVYDLIEKMYPNKKKIELFARNQRENWKSWGNEIKSE